MRKKWIVVWISIGLIVLIGALSFILEKFSIGKPQAIILIDAADTDEEILEWFANNKEIRDRFDFRAIIAVNVDTLYFNPFQFYNEVEEILDINSVIHATMPDLDSGLYFAIKFFNDKEMFKSDVGKNLIVVSGNIDKFQNGLKEFKKDNPEVNVFIATLLNKNNEKFQERVIALFFY